MTVQELIDRLNMLPKDLTVVMSLEKDLFTEIYGVSKFETGYDWSPYVVVLNRHGDGTFCPICNDYVSVHDINLYGGVCNNCYKTIPKFKVGEMVKTISDKVQHAGHRFIVHKYIADNRIVVSCNGVEYTFHEHELMPV